MSNEESNVAEKVKEMAKLAILSNRISSIHEKNLKHYPFIAFNGVKSMEMEYDLSRVKTEEDKPETSMSLVTYRLALENNSDNEHLDRRCKALETWVRQLLWKDITVKVYFGETLMFKSDKNE